MDKLFLDIKFALRGLGKNRHFTLLAIVALALGTGSATVIFSAIYGVVLDAFPYKDANRLSTLAVVDPTEPNDSNGETMSLSELAGYRNQNRVFEDLAGISGGIFVLYRTADVTREISASFLTANSFEFLGVPPVLGRWATPEDTKPGAPPVFVMSDRLWHQQFNGDPKILGKSFTFTLNTFSLKSLNVPRTLVGIMPPRFRLGGADIWIPLLLSRGQVASDEMLSGFYVTPLGRLRRGVSLQTAAADLDVIAHNLAKIYPSDYPKQFKVTTASYTDKSLGGFKTMIYPVLGAVAMLVLIACSNVANLLLARATVREREIAIRAAMGASRGRLIGQLLVESLILAAAGCLAGCVLAWWGIKEIVPLIPSGTLPQEAVIKLNPVVLLFSLGVTVLSTLLCGLVPALHAVRGELSGHLTGARKTREGSRLGLHGKLRGGAVVAEVALSIVLLIGAGLMMRTFFALTHVDLGFSPNNLIFTAMHLPLNPSAPLEHNRELKRTFFRHVLENLTSLPGVTGATVAMSRPTDQGAADTEVSVLGMKSSERLTATLGFVSEGYFQTLGVHLLRGRLMTASEADSVALVTVVNEVLARKFFGNRNPLGQKIRVNGLEQAKFFPQDAYFEIVGVVSDFKNDGVKAPPVPEAFLPYTILPAGAGIMLRTAVNPDSLLPSVFRRLWAVDRNITPVGTGTVAGILHDDNYAEPEFELVTLGAFAGIGLVLVVIGVFSVMAYTVSLQTHDIGTRMALGAQQADILRMVLGRGLGILATGLAFGLLASFALTRVLASRLWGVSATDPRTFSLVAGLTIFVGLLACLLPARQASQVDPLIALRHE